VRSCNQGQIVDVAEFLCDLVSKQPTYIVVSTRKKITTRRVYIPAPLGLTAQVSTSSGSDQTKSQKAPS
jgi:hypothetical protein